jgi:hypothetical protein
MFKAIPALEQPAAAFRNIDPVLWSSNYPNSNSTTIPDNTQVLRVVFNPKETSGRI